MVQYLALVIITFVLLIAIEVGVMALLCSSYPNRISFPFLTYLPLYQILWEQNAIGSLEAMASQPLMQLNDVDAGTNLNAWGIYYYPVTVILHFVMAIYASLMLRRMVVRDAATRQPVFLFAGAIFLILSITYVSVAAHCSGPVWVIDVILRSLMLPTNVTAPFWQWVYPDTRTVFVGIQYVMGFAGVTTLIYMSIPMLKGRK